jgi:hypothetical protein
MLCFLCDQQHDRLEKIAACWSTAQELDALFWRVAVPV